MDEPHIENAWESFWIGRALLAYVERSEEHLDSRGTSVQTVVFDLTPADEVLPYLPATSESWRRARGRNLPTAQLVAEFGSEDSRPFLPENSWHTLRLDKNGSLLADLYRDLDQIPPVSMRFSFEQALPETTQDQLASTYSIADDFEALSEEIEEAFASPTASGVAVYDVGQGNCGAACMADGRPTIYFDFGGGCLQNTKTYPPRRTPPEPLSFCARPPVVLSHWDWDHWFSATKSPLPGSTWLVPHQSFGPRTAKFVYTLMSTCHVLRWSTGPATLCMGHVTLVRCTGRSKNDSGIAAFVNLPAGVVLLPGDAAFDFVPVPPGNPGALFGLVATHHGSNHTGAPIPRPGAVATLAYSYGDNNSFGHPGQAAQSLYAAEKWSRSLSTPNGNIGVGLKPMSLPCASACTTCCTLHLQQSLP